MDSTYDVEKAKEYVEELIEKRKDAGEISMAGKHDFDYNIMKAGIPSCNRILNFKGEDLPAEEVLFRLQGVLMEVNLSPLKVSPSKKLTTRDNLYSVQISGLGSEAFQQSILNMYLWDLRLSRQFEEQYWHPWSAQSGKAFPTVQFTSRILTPAHLCQESESLPVLPGMGKHAKALVDEGTHRYIQDNVVDLYHHVKSGSQNSYKEVPYTTFRVGDIVEVSFSLISVPTNAGKRCMKMVLRGLCLESDVFTNAMMIRKAMDTAETKKRKRSDSDDATGRLKVNFTRPRCYKKEIDVEKEVEDADSRLHDMEISTER